MKLASNHRNYQNTDLHSPLVDGHLHPRKKPRLPVLFYPHINYLSPYDLAGIAKPCDNIDI
jgi:hypothetical protein